jgi:hypothetical protein
MRTVFIFFLLLTLANPYVANSDTKLRAYFSNDSINGFMISDAYETHNMGLSFERDDSFLSFDLGIVSPDMHVYKNEYRVANRSFGELISFTAGKNFILKNQYSGSYFVRVTSSGTYGIDKLQDFMHRLLTLQPVNYVNDLVRMPNDTWYGIGGYIYSDPPTNYKYLNAYGVRSYLGTDRTEIAPFMMYNKKYSSLNLTGELGLRYIFFDNIVSAKPISALHRNTIPYAELGLNFEYLGLNWYIKDKFSLPTIASDSNLFGVLSLGVEFIFE